MKKLHPSTTMARLRKIMKSEDFNKIRITSSKTLNGYWIDTVDNESVVITTNGRGYISYLVYTSADRTEKGYIMNPDNIICRKFAFALHFVLNERRDWNMFEKSYFDEMSNFARDFRRGYANYWETVEDILKA